MRILGIETSCDETAAAVVENGRLIISNVVASSQEIQKKYGGIIPEQAAREQVKAILPVIDEALSLASNSQHLTNRTQKKHNGRKAAVNKHNSRHYLRDSVDIIAVTIGPGLIGSLLVGVETAKTLAYVFNKSIIPVNHLMGHIYAAWLDTNSQPTDLNHQTHQTKTPEFPAICLIVSGGHTLLSLMQEYDKFKLLGQTRDDAAGEAFDKTARLIGLSYPGGPAIEKAAKEGNPKAFSFPRPMIDSNDYDFSFSGLKTAVLREVQKLKNNGQGLLIKNQRSDLAASIQEAIVEVLVEKTIRAATHFRVKSIIIGGGVAANKRLREKFASFDSQFSIFIPPPRLCTDNAAVIAAAAYFHQKETHWKKITAVPDLQFPSNHL